MKARMPLLLCAALLALQILLAAAVAHAQTRIPLIVVLTHGSEGGNRAWLDPLRDGMRDLGWVEGRNYRMEPRSSDGRLERLTELARELLRLNPDVAVGLPAVSAAALWRESKTVPIVTVGAGALQSGMIASLARPGGNVTGVNNQQDELTQKLFELLKELAPRAKRVMALSSGRGLVESEVRGASRVAAKAFDMTLIEAVATSPEDISQLSARCERERCEALVALPDPSLSSYGREVVSMAARLRLPAIYPGLDYPRDQGLIGFAANSSQTVRRAAHYVDRILKGAKPADLPVEQPTKYDLVINMKTAKALGLAVPESILVRADEMIE